MSASEAPRPKMKSDAIRVVALAMIVGPDGDLILQGTPGTLLRWVDQNVDRHKRYDTVLVAWDAYMFVGGDQCCSRHCRREGGIQIETDASSIRYIGAGEWVDEVLSPEEKS